MCDQGPILCGLASLSHRIAFISFISTQVSQHVLLVLRAQPKLVLAKTHACFRSGWSS